MIRGLIEWLIVRWRVRQARAWAPVTALHEASHGVIALRLSRPLDHVSIIPGSASTGRVLHMAAPLPDADRQRFGDLTARLDPTFTRCLLRVLSDEEIIILLAGGIAAQRIAPWSPLHTWRTTRTDRRVAREIAGRHAASAASTRARLRWLKVEAREIVAANWAPIEAVARELLDNGRGELSGNEVAAIITACDHGQSRGVARDNKMFNEIPVGGAF